MSKAKGKKGKGASGATPIASAPRAQSAAPSSTTTTLLPPNSDNKQQPPPPEHQRLLWLLASLVGNIVEVETRDGTTYEGVLHSAMPDVSAGGLIVSLRMAFKLSTPSQTPTHSRKRTGQPIDNLLLPAGEVLQICARSVDDPLIGGPSSSTTPGSAASTPGLHRGGFATDAEISASAGVGAERELSRWVPDEVAAGQPLTTLEGSTSMAGWDQFRANEKLFGVRSTYKEETYTTALDKNSEFYRKHQHVADRIASQLEQEKTTDVHLREERGLELQQEISEEERYGAVITQTRRAVTATKQQSQPQPTNGTVYVPPHKRGGSSGKTSPALLVVPSPQQQQPQKAGAKTPMTPPSPGRLSTAAGAGAIKPQLSLSPLNKLIQQERPRSNSDRPAPMAQIELDLKDIIAANSSTAAAAAAVTAASSMTKSPLMFSQSLLTRSFDTLPDGSKVFSPRSPMASPRPNDTKSALFAERVRLRQALLDEKFSRPLSARSSMETPSPGSSPMMSYLVADPKQLSALQLEPQTPKLSSEVVRDWKEFQKNRELSVKAKVLEDLKNFKVELPPKSVVAGSLAFRKQRSASVLTRPAPSTLSRASPIVSPSPSASSATTVKRHQTEESLLKEDTTTSHLPSSPLLMNETSSSITTQKKKKEETAAVHKEEKKKPQQQDTTTQKKKQPQTPTPPPTPPATSPAATTTTTPPTTPPPEKKLNPEAAIFNPSAPAFNPSASPFKPAASSSSTTAATTTTMTLNAAAPAFNPNATSFTPKSPNLSTVHKPVTPPVTPGRFSFVPVAETTKLSRVYSDGMCRRLQSSEPTPDQQSIHWPGGVVGYKEVGMEPNMYVPGNQFGIRAFPGGPRMMPAAVPQQMMYPAGPAPQQMQFPMYPTAPPGAFYPQQPVPMMTMAPQGFFPAPPQYSMMMQFPAPVPPGPYAAQYPRMAPPPSADHK